MTLREGTVGVNPEDRFRSLILGLYEKTRQKVVVLIDEYDKPLIDNLDNMDEARKIQGLLKRFYGVLKLADEHLRFIFITGVSKFAKVSIFSDLNQLTDLTFNPQYATMVGLTETELETYYRDHINAIAQIKSKRYVEKYHVTGKPIHAIGIGVDCVSKSISDWRIEAI